MATTAGKAARRKYGTKVNAKRAFKHHKKEFGTPFEEKEKYRQMKRAKKARKHGH
jgi:hypothetical protein